MPKSGIIKIVRRKNSNDIKNYANSICINDYDKNRFFSDSRSSNSYYYHGGYAIWEERMKAISNLNKFEEDLNKMDTTQTEVTQPTSQLTEEKVQELALKALQQQQAQQATESNLKTVNDTLAKIFGAEAENKLEAKCKELGISKEFGMSIAKDSPKAFLKMLGLDEPAMVSVDSIIGKGHLTSAQTSQPTQPMSDIEKLAKDPSLSRNKQFLQELFKHPEKVLYTDTTWNGLGK